MQLIQTKLAADACFYMIFVVQRFVQNTLIFLVYLLYH